MTDSLAPLEHDLGYSFSNIHLLHQALTHSSLSTERNVASYERMEFLGDTVLALCISEFLYTNYSNESEGDLSKRRSALVCGQTLAEIATQINLGTYIQLSENEALNGGRNNPAILEDVVEAILGAVYLDGGLEAVKTIVDRFFVPLADTHTTPPQDPKTALQEWAQGKRLPTPVYTVIDQTGPSHAPTFLIKAEIEGQGSAKGEGSNKRKAERLAAENLLKKVQS